MQFVTNILRSVHMSTVGKRIWRRELELLKGTSDPAARCIARALRVTLAGDLVPEEEFWVRRIESLRKELNASKEPLVPAAGTAKRKASVGQTVGRVCYRASKPYLWALLLFKIVRELRPACCLEMGTCLGISAAYQAAALSLNGHGTLTTLEGEPNRAAIAQQNFERLDLDSVQVVVGTFRNTLAEVLSQLSPVDLVFVDGHHRRQATVSYFEQILPHLADRAVMVFDDISWSKEMKEAWCTIKGDPRLTTRIDLSAVGICTVLKPTRSNAT